MSAVLEEFDGCAQCLTSSKTGVDVHEVSGNGWRLIQSDNREVLRAMEDASISHTICDPPYDEHTQANIRGVYNSGNVRVKKHMLKFEALNDYSFVDELLRVTKGWVICFCALEQLGDYKHAAGEAWIRSGVFHKRQSAPQISGDRPANSCEGVAIMHRPGRKTWNGGGKHAFWSSNVVRGEREHPTQKPIDLMIAIVDMFTQPGDLVFDPFAGSCTTGIASMRLGRNFLGVEMNQEHFEAGASRLEAEEFQMDPVDVRSGQVPLFAKDGT